VATVQKTDSLCRRAFRSSVRVVEAHMSWVVWQQPLASPARFYCCLPEANAACRPRGIKLLALLDLLNYYLS